MEKQPRINPRAAVRIPSFANLVIYGTGVYLTVTFRIKERYVPHFREEVQTEENYNVYTFSRFGKNYITATISLPFDIIVNRYRGDIENAVYSICYKMRDDLKIRSREAQIASLQAEIENIKATNEE